jgi:hypothetical protein
MLFRSAERTTVSRLPQFFKQAFPSAVTDDRSIVVRLQHSEKVNIGRTVRSAGSTTVWRLVQRVKLCDPRFLADPMLTVVKFPQFWKIPPPRVWTVSRSVTSTKERFPKKATRGISFGPVRIKCVAVVIWSSSPA